ncbi:esterase/lipase family protein [Williamsia sp. MIQD14]|uniref:esterase/lipase family protein n=1 Tax=Williamsia sp. MIQD14 TaxID=3425703 RepID=UPI003D9FF188
MTSREPTHRLRRLRTRRHLRGLTTAAAAATVVASTVLMSGPATARPVSCDRPVLLVGEVASDTASMAGLRRDLERSGACVTTVDYGITPAATALARAGGPRLNGLTSLEDSGSEVARYLRSTASPAGPLTVVAHGGGALAVQYALQHGVAAARIARLVTIGPLWNGTDVAGIADVEQVSRRLGTYDTVLRLERPIVDPICASCRQLVTGSDFLVAMRRAVFPTPGVAYVDIASRTDGLAGDPRTSAAPGARLIVLQTVDPRANVDHFRLPADTLVRSLVVATTRG